MTVDARRTTRSAAAATTTASRVSGRLSLFAHIIDQRGQKRVVHLRTPLAVLMEHRHSSRVTPDQRGCDENLFQIEHRIAAVYSLAALHVGGRIFHQRQAAIWVAA